MEKTENADENGSVSLSFDYHLVVCYHLFTDEIKYLLITDPAETTVGKLPRVAFGHWRTERCFEDGKGEIGLDH